MKAGSLLPSCCFQGSNQGYQARGKGPLNAEPNLVWPDLVILKITLTPSGWKEIEAMINFSDKSILQQLKD